MRGVPVVAAAPPTPPPSLKVERKSVPVELRTPHLARAQHIIMLATVEISNETEK